MIAQGEFPKATKAIYEAAIKNSINLEQVREKWSQTLRSIYKVIEAIITIESFSSGFS